MMQGVVYRLHLAWDWDCIMRLFCYISGVGNKQARSSIERMSIMKSSWIILTLTCVVMADPPQATLDALKVPDAVEVPREEKKLAKAEMPKGLYEAMSEFDWGGGTGEIPDQVTCIIVDLNSDKKPEYFALTQMGGSGGPLYLIFTQVDGAWKNMGDAGNFCLLPLKNGWHPLVSFGRSGPYYFKHFYEYKDGCYQHTETHEILDGKVTQTKIEKAASKPEPKAEQRDKKRSE